MRLAAALVALCVPGVRAFGEAQKYLIVSTPSTSKIAYLKLPASGAPATGGEPMRVLVSQGLTFPQGIAVDDFRRKLYVADPNLGRLVGYQIIHDGDALKVGSMQTVASGVEVRAVAVDGLGNVFFTDEPSNRIMRVSAAMVAAGMTTPETVYSGGSVSSVSAPGGIALDNYFVYWLNKASGEQAGTLVRARQRPVNLTKAGVTVSNVLRLADNAVKCYGVCLALGSIFYTDERTSLYGVPRAATARNEVVTVSAGLQEPRGCAFDGDGTVYVADKVQNAVYQFASNMRTLSPNRALTKAADLQGAYGVAVYSRLAK